MMVSNKDKAKNIFPLSLQAPPYSSAAVRWGMGIVVSPEHLATSFSSYLRKTQGTTDW